MMEYLQIIPKRYLVVLFLFVSDLMKEYMNNCPFIVFAEITMDQKIVVDHEIKIVPAQFNWTSVEQGIALGAHGVGMIFTVFFGPIMHRIGGASFVSVGMFGIGILTLIHPLVMNIHIYLLIAVRVLFGFFESMTLCGSVDVLYHWSPNHERARATTVIYVGYGIGGAMTYPICGFIISYLGWPYVFYTCGVVFLLWCSVWSIYVSNDPATDKFISKQEKDYLSKAISTSKEKVAIPYKEIFTSVPIYALFNDYVVFYVLIATAKFLPLYVKHLYDMDVQQVGLISSIPLVVSLITQPIFACLIDYIRKTGFNVGKLHQWCFFVGKSITVLFYLSVLMVNHKSGFIICIALAEISFSIVRVSYNSIVIDTAGPYAGFLQSWIMVAISIGLFANSVFVGSTIKNQTESEWNRHYLYISVLTIYSLIIFLIFGSGDLQPWARVIPEKVADKTVNETEKNTRSVKL